MVFLSRLTAKSGAPIVFVWCERLPWGRGYALHFRQPPQDIYSDDLKTSATGINRAVENCVRECPAQYQWSYKRFRTRPAGRPRYISQSIRPALVGLLGPPEEYLHFLRGLHPLANGCVYALEINISCCGIISASCNALPSVFHAAE
jgi:hypothetical protein